MTNEMFGAICWSEYFNYWEFHIFEILGLLEFAPFLVGISIIIVLVKSLELCFCFNVKENNILPCLPIKTFLKNYRNAAVLRQSECTCLHKTVNMVIFIPTQKGEHSCKS